MCIRDRGKAMGGGEENGREGRVVGRGREARPIVHIFGYRTPYDADAIRLVSLTYGQNLRRNSTVGDSRRQLSCVGVVGVYWPLLSAVATTIFLALVLSFFSLSLLTR